MKNKVNVGDIIQEIGEIIAQNSSKSTILKKICKHIAEHLRADYCSIYVYNEKKDNLMMAATCGHPQKVIGKLTIEPKTGITGNVYSSKRIVNVTNPHKRADYAYFPELKEEKIGSVLSVPIKKRNNVLGVINLESVQKKHFADIIVETVLRLSFQIANVIMDYDIFHLATEAGVEDRKVIPNQRLTGSAISQGISTGRAMLVDFSDILDDVPIETVDDSEAELVLFTDALENAKSETKRLEKEASRILTESDASIFYSHLLILEDKQFIDMIKEKINSGKSVKFALKKTLLQLKVQFSQIDSETIRERLADIKDVVLRILHSVDNILRGRANSESGFDDSDEKIIIVSHELFPSQLISWPLHKIVGIVCETGGATSHVAIISKALKLPTLMGVKNATKLIDQGSSLLLDCFAGNCFVNPNCKLLNKFATSLKAHEESKDSNAKPEPFTQQTIDGEEIGLHANISLISEIPMLNQYGANGIGLYRTEFLYMVRTTAPAWRDQIKVYSRFTEACDKKEFTIRLLDVGGDKPVSYLNFEEETNPLLGVRGLRLLLRNPILLNEHIEAILRTTVTARVPVKILIPMVTTVDELLLVKEIIDAKREALEKKLCCRIDNYKLGIMVETPAILWELDKVLQHIEFVSIGSNDLVQYSFAVDRNNSTAVETFNGINPSTIRMFKIIADTMAKYPDKSLTLCGEMGSDINALPLLLGAGLRSFSMSPWQIPRIRKVIQQLSTETCQQLCEQYIAMERQADAEALVSQFISEAKLVLEDPK